jgi:hypothetical protein
MEGKFDLKEIEKKLHRTATEFGLEASSFSHIHKVKLAYKGTKSDRIFSVPNQFHLIQILEAWIIRNSDQRNC